MLVLVQVVLVLVASDVLVVVWYSVVFRRSEGRVLLVQLLTIGTRVSIGFGSIHLFFAAPGGRVLLDWS